MISFEGLCCTATSRTDHFDYLSITSLTRNGPPAAGRGQPPGSARGLISLLQQPLRCSATSRTDHLADSQPRKPTTSNKPTNRPPGAAWGAGAKAPGGHKNPPPCCSATLQTDHVTAPKRTPNKNTRSESPTKTSVCIALSADQRPPYATKILIAPKT